MSCLQWSVPIPDGQKVLIVVSFISSQTDFPPKLPSAFVVFRRDGTL